MPEDSGGAIRAESLEQAPVGMDEVCPATLRRHLRHPDPGVRRSCALLLGRMKDEEAISLLLALTADECFPVAAAAVEALGEIGADEAVYSLIQLFGELQAEHLRPEVGVALGRTRDPAGVQRLIEVVAGEDPDARTAAIRGLGATSDPAVVPHLDRAMHRLTLRIQEVWQQQRVDRADLLLICEFDEERVAVVRALGQIKGPASLDLLVRAVQDRSPYVMGHAALTLAEWIEQDPEPEYVGVLAVLRRQLPPWRFELGTGRTAVREAVRRISRALSTCSQLPVPAGPPAGERNLPRPSQE
jgi:HEAT repeat protein